MKLTTSRVLLPVGVALCLLYLISPVFSQKSCRTSKSGARCKRGPVQVSNSVKIQVTNEVNGKVSTYLKVFPLNHVPPAQRKRYVNRLMDSLMHAGGEEWDDSDETAFIPGNGGLAFEAGDNGEQGLPERNPRRKEWEGC